MLENRSRTLKIASRLCLLCGCLAGVGWTPAMAQLQDPPAVEWDRLVDWQSPNGTHNFYDAAFLPDDGAAFVGRWFPDGRQPGGFVVRADSGAQMLWATFFEPTQGPREAYCVAPTADGGCITGGSGWDPATDAVYGSLAHLRQDGTLDWHEGYEGEGDMAFRAFVCIRETADRGFVGVVLADHRRDCVAGDPGPDGCRRVLFLLRTDARGRELWRQQVFALPAGGVSADAEVRDLTSGDVMSLVSTDSQQRRESHLIHVDAAGAIISSRSLDDVVGCPAGSLPGSSFALTAHNVVVRVAAEGGSACKRYLLTDGVHSLTPLMSSEMPDGSIVGVVGTDRSLRIERIDALGGTMWRMNRIRRLGKYPCRSAADGGYRFISGNTIDGEDWARLIKLGPDRTVPHVFRRGDTDGDAAVNLTDAVFVLNALFQDGPQPACTDAADSNDDGDLNITDPIYLLNYLFLESAPPRPPGPASCGLDPTADELACAVGAGC